MKIHEFENNIMPRERLKLSENQSVEFDCPNNTVRGNLNDLQHNYYKIMQISVPLHCFHVCVEPLFQQVRQIYNQLRYQSSNSVFLFSKRAIAPISVIVANRLRTGSSSREIHNDACCDDIILCCCRYR